MPMMLSLAATQMKMTPAEGVTARDDQRRLQLEPRRQDWIARSRASWRTSRIFDCEDYRELAYYFGVSQTRAVYVRGERVLSGIGEPRPEDFSVCASESAITRPTDVAQRFAHSFARAPLPSLPRMKIEVENAAAQAWRRCASSCRRKKCARNGMRSR